MMSLFPRFASRVGLGFCVAVMCAVILPVVSVGCYSSGPAKPVIKKPTGKVGSDNPDQPGGVPRQPLDN